MTAVLAIDIGGTGSRALLADVGDEHAPIRRFAGSRVRVTADGSNAGAVALALVDAVRRDHAAVDITAVVVGATGLASLVSDPAGLARDIAAQVAAPATASTLGAPHLVAASMPTPAASRSASSASDAAPRPVFPASRLAPPTSSPVRRPRMLVAVDAATAHAGALDGAPGAIVALGTGAVAFGTDWTGVFRRADGWGHLLGDRGGGAWIGIRAAQAATLAHDGVDTAGVALLAALTDRLGPPPSWPRQLYTRDDRAAILAGLVPAVAAVAHDGDATARGILTDAGIAAARSCLAALGTDLPPTVAVTGGIAAIPLVREAFAIEARRLRPDAAVVESAGDPLAGAVLLARRLAGRDLPARPPYLYTAR